MFEFLLYIYIYQRSHNIIWFDPPYSMNIKTNAAKFLTILDRNFSKTHRLHNLFNRNNVKVSYSCPPNISSIIASHNRKILSNENQRHDPKCKCRKKDTCPLNGKYLDSQIIYSCHVKKIELDEGVCYIGLTENTFKERWNQHRNTFKHENKANSTEVSNYVWELKRKGATPIISWEVIDHARPYKNGSKFCHLCSMEKYHIITSNRNLLTKRSELVSTCRHVNKFLLKNIKESPQDLT